jgi:hypothetical protein
MSVSVRSATWGDDCPICGAGLDGEVTICPSCGHELAEPAAVATTLERRTCTVRRWKGYRSSTFYAETDEGVTVAESPSFRCGGSGPKVDDAGARAALDGLLARLEELGWTATGARGADWYAITTEQLVEVRAPAARVTPPRHEIAPPPQEIAPPAQHRPVAVPAVVEPPERVAPAAPVAAKPRQLHRAVATPAPRRVASVKALPASPPGGGADAQWPMRRRVLVGLAVVAAAASVGGGVMSIASSYRSPQPRATAAASGPTVHAAAPAAPKRQVATAKPASPAPPPAVRLRITATGGSSWLEIRRGSKLGPVLYAGELTDGSVRQFRGGRIWARFAAAGNLTITVDGKPYTAIGTIDHLFVARST